MEQTTSDRFPPPDNFDIRRINVPEHSPVKDDTTLGDVLQEVSLPACLPGKEYTALPQLLDDPLIQSVSTAIKFDCFSPQELLRVYRTFFNAFHKREKRELSDVFPSTL